MRDNHTAIWKEKPMQPQYIVNNNPIDSKESIIKEIDILLRSCNNISLLDLILKLLQKSV